jgi:hypothetical protein
MQRPILRLGVALAIALGIVAACGGEDPPPPPEASLFITPNPRQINDQGQASQLEVSATFGDGTAGTGAVTLKTSAGALGNGAAEETLTLSNGRASTRLTCNKAVDPRCAGNVRIDGTWDTTTGSTTVTVGSGNTGTDAGTDGGTRTDGGVRDGGATTTYTVAIETSKALLVATTSDQTIVTATVTQTATRAPVSGVQVSFSTTLGSFSPSGGTATVQADTNAEGKAQVILTAANAAAGRAVITATYSDGMGLKEIPFAAVSSLVYVANSAKPLLGLESSGRETTTPVSFRVINSSQQIVPDVEISFEVSGAAGASVTPTAISNAQGIATTTLRSGNALGSAIVRATVTATRGQTPEVSASHPGTPIVGGKPADSGLQVTCVAKTLAAEAPSGNPPALNTDCTATLVDRFSNPVGLSTPVQWVAEAGAVVSPVDSKPQMGSTPAADTGVAKTIFRTNGGIYPPQPVTPMPGEKFAVNATDPANPNPRDMLVTVIAIVAGEEQFVDGSGSGPTSGQLNGRWDPGEWFTDLSEPFVDRNDNGVYDTGEYFSDTQRVDCANPSAPPSTNGRWDGPNGCWDSNTQIWRSTHIAYTGPLRIGAGALTITPPPPGGYLVPSDGGVVNVPFYYSDTNLNRVSLGTFSLTRTEGTRGQAALVGGTLSPAAYGGFDINYRLVEGTTLSDGGIQLGPRCDTSADTPPNSDTSPVATRCVRSTEFVFPNYNSGIVRMTGATTPQPPLADGGVAPPENSTFNISGPGNPPATGSFQAQYE